MKTNVILLFSLWLLPFTVAQSQTQNFPSPQRIRPGTVFRQIPGVKTSPLPQLGPGKLRPAQGSGQPMIGFPSAQPQQAGGINQLAGNTFKQQFDAEVQKHFEDFNLPGVVVLMARDNLLVYKKSLGFADIESGVPVNENHVFRLASISKWVAGVLSLKLEEQGQINLNAKTKDCLPGAPTQHSSRVVDLLTCRAGIRHYGGTTSPSSPTNWSNTIFENAGDAAPMIWNDPLAVPVGSYHYSTHSYTLLGACLEQATGKSTPQLIRDSLSAPYGLNTLRTEDLSLNVNQRVKLYQAIDGDDFSKGNQLVDRDNLTWKFLGGGLECSGMDLLRLGMKFCNHQIVSPAGVEKMLTRLDHDLGYAYGANTGVENGNRLIAKNGGQTGASTYIWMVPEKRMVMVVLINRKSGKATTLGKRLRAIALGTDAAENQAPDLIVDSFKRTGTPIYRSGKWEIPVEVIVKNTGQAGTENQFCNGIRIGDNYRWVRFMQTLPPNGQTKTVSGVVKVSDPGKLMRGRTVTMVAHADAPIAAADTSISPAGRVDESNDNNNTKLLKVTIPGGAANDLTIGTTNDPGLPTPRTPTRVNPDRRPQRTNPTRTNPTRTNPTRTNPTRTNPTRTQPSSAKRTNPKAKRTSGQGTSGQGKRGDAKRSQPKSSGKSKATRSNLAKQKRTSPSNSKTKKRSKKSPSRLKN